MQHIHYQIGDTVNTLLGEGIITMIRVSSSKGVRFYVVGNGFEQYFHHRELEALNKRENIVEVDGDDAKKCKKIPFDTYANAQRSLKWLIANGTAHKSAYKCPYCGKWHLTIWTPHTRNLFKKWQKSS